MDVKKVEDDLEMNDVNSKKAGIPKGEEEKGEEKMKKKEEEISYGVGEEIVPWGGQAWCG